MDDKPPANADSPAGDPWLSREQAAARANVSTKTIDRARASGALRWAGNKHGPVRIRTSWLDAWLAGQAILMALLTLFVAAYLVCFCMAGHPDGDHGVPSPLGHFCPR